MTAQFVASHSIIQVDARSATARRVLTDAHAMHDTVMSGFRSWAEDGSKDPRAQVGVLSTWSADLKERRLLLVVQSAVMPDWSGLTGRDLLAPVKVQTIDTTIREGDTYTFRTVVSAHGLRKDVKTGQVRRLPHTTPHHVREWFLRRLQPEPAPAIQRAPFLGITTDHEKLAVRALPPVIATTKHEGLNLPRHEIRGTLTVTHPEAFATALTDGIGRGRAYSCGLILIRPSA
ncbi:type I-E CRISPR-associated protein Cas6/Cse3/CasE [Streptomyces sp. NPDC090085]|uniref:type I-E CRISPR-associated protein Cas6/Cse3/CasE n=1 Tax=Streptomyces sp. NPDC090085 TaxID=3365943 RepID=UPI0038294F9B